MYETFESFRESKDLSAAHKWLYLCLITEKEIGVPMDMSHRRLSRLSGMPRSSIDATLTTLALKGLLSLSYEKSQGQNTTFITLHQQLDLNLIMFKRTLPPIGVQISDTLPPIGVQISDTLPPIGVQISDSYPTTVQNTDSSTLELHLLPLDAYSKGATVQISDTLEQEREKMPPIYSIYTDHSNIESSGRNESIVTLPLEEAVGSITIVTSKQESVKKPQRTTKVVTPPQESSKPIITTTMQQVIDEWRSLFKKKIVVTSSIIEAAKELAEYDPEIGEIKECRKWLYKNDRNRYYETHGGLTLSQLSKKFEGFRSTKEQSEQIDNIPAKNIKKAIKIDPFMAKQLTPAQLELMQQYA